MAWSRCGRLCSQLSTYKQVGRWGQGRSAVAVQELVFSDGLLKVLQVPSQAQ